MLRGFYLACKILQVVQQPTYQAEKKRATVQQTIGITDNVADNVAVHYRPVYAIYCIAYGPRC